MAAGGASSAGGSSYEDARRTDTIGRLRRATCVMLLPLTLALAVEVRVFGDTAPVRTLGLIGMLALATVTHVLVQQRGAGRRAMAIAMGFVLALSVLVLCTLIDSPQNLHVQMGAVSALMMGAAILIPWGFAAQAVVAVFLAAGYVLLPELAGHGSVELTSLAFALADCVGLSVIGAYVLERQRRALFAEREQTQAMLRQRELLLEAGRELNATLDLDQTVHAITRLGHTLVGGDTVALVLIDERRGALRTASIAGELMAADRELLNLEVPLAALQPLVDEIRARGVLQIPGGSLDGFAELLREQFGVTASICVGIERSGRLLGYVNFNYRGESARFSEQQIRLAQGFAPKCAIALANAGLVADLQRANRVKTEFVSTMSHELRTPLNVMLGYTDVLDDVVTDPEGRVGIDRIRAAGRELLDLVETTLDLNRLESGQDPARLDPLPMRELWDELAAEFAALPRPQGVVLRWEQYGAPVALTDRRKLKIIVKNLIGNALKFTREGEVVAGVRIQGDRCVVVVRDTGIGIPADHLPTIFEMFRQVDSSDRRSFGGVGLGLYIVRKLVEQLEASLDVTSTLGRGTTFTVNLPLADASRVAAAA